MAMLRAELIKAREYQEKQRRAAAAGRKGRTRRRATCAWKRWAACSPASSR